VADLLRSDFKLAPWSHVPEIDNMTKQYAVLKNSIIVGWRLWRFLLRYFWDHRGLSGRLQATPQPGGHGHRDHIHRSGQGRLRYPPVKEWWRSSKTRSGGNMCVVLVHEGASRSLITNMSKEDPKIFCCCQK
jgi:hypothetical protein